jgi:hypothetical protein
MWGCMEEWGVGTGLRGQRSMPKPSLAPLLSNINGSQSPHHRRYCLACHVPCTPCAISNIVHCHVSCGPQVRLVTIVFTTYYGTVLRVTLFVWSKGLFVFFFFFCYYFFYVSFRIKHFFSFLLKKCFQSQYTFWFLQKKKRGKYLLCFHIIRGTMGKRDKISCKEKECENKKFLEWNWNSMQLSVHISCNLVKQLWEFPNGAYLPGQTGWDLIGQVGLMPSHNNSPKGVAE